MSGVVKARRRKPLNMLVSGAIDAPWMAAALEAARLAPSARNRQPWRFRLERGAVIIAADRASIPSAISKRLDCGIAMLHFELGRGPAGSRENGKASPLRMWPGSSIELAPWKTKRSGVQKPGREAL